MRFLTNHTKPNTTARFGDLGLYRWLLLLGLFVLFNLSQQAKAAETFNCTNCPSGQFDTASIDSIITVPAGVCPAGIHDINISANISNTWISDIDMFITSPAGISAILASDNCDTNDDMNAIFDDETTGNLVGVSCSSTPPAIRDSVRPLELLDKFDNTAAAGSWTLTVTDDDTFNSTTLNTWSLIIECNPILSISRTMDAAEPSTNGQFTVTASPTNNTGASIIGGLVYSGTAIAGTDYLAVTHFSIPNGASSTTVSVQPINDMLIEGPETITATLSQAILSSSRAASPKATPVDPTKASATIQLNDDDNNYTLAIAKTVDAAEPSTHGQFTVTVTPTNISGAAITGTVAYSGTATSGTDYIAPLASFSIPNGSSTAVLDFAVIDDTLVEGTETVTAMISAPSVGTITTAAATANITDNDTYTLSIAKTTDAAEPSTNGQFTVTVTPANSSGAAITGTVAYSGTATSGTDYTPSSASFSIPNGSSTAVLDFAVLDDTAVEGTETVTATISAPSIGTIITAAATANLADNDTAPTYTLAIAKTTDGAEPSTNGQFTVTVTPANSSGAAITGTVAYSGTATSGTDYTAPSTSFSIPSGSSTAVLDFAVIDDTAVEGTETVTATISAPSMGTITTAAATANLADNDTAPTYTLAIAKTTDGAEPSTHGQFTVTVTPANSSGVAINGTATYSGTATSGTDYTPSSASFSIPSGSSTAVLDFAVLDDTAVEGTETVTATIAAPSVGSITTAAATANLVDNDSETTYKLSIAKGTDGAEPSTNGQFIVSVSPANNTGNPINGILTYGGTATKDTDYTAPSSFTIPNGASSATVDFSVINDSEVEGSETIIANLSLSASTSGRSTSKLAAAELITLDTSTASATITDDDTSTPIPIFSPLGLLALLGGLFWLGRRYKL